RAGGGRPKRWPRNPPGGRLERGLRPVSAGTAASSFGQNRRRATPAGSAARTARPQPGQRSRCNRCSRISTATGGSSATWCRAGTPAGSRSSEDVAAAAAPRPVVDDLGHALEWKQRPPVTGMTRLAALLAPCPARPSPLTQPGRIVARRQRRVTRIALQPLLELLDPLRQRVELRVLRLQSRRQRQQHLDDRLASLRVDRLRLRALHTRSFATPKRVPAD